MNTAGSIAARPYLFFASGDAHRALAASASFLKVFLDLNVTPTEGSKPEKQDGE